MPRLFTGIEIPALIGDQLSGQRGGLPGARWIDPENYHLTLRFIGDVDMDIAEEIADALTRIHRPNFVLKLAELAVFGAKKPRAIVVRARMSPELADLQTEHERLMQRIGLPPETRKFAPHVTLARLRNATSHDIGNYLSLHGAFSVGAFPIDRFVLFSARQSTGGGPYVIETVYPLIGQSAPTMDERGMVSWQNN